LTISKEIAKFLAAKKKAQSKRFKLYVKTHPADGNAANGAGL